MHEERAPSSLEEGVGGGGVSRETLRQRAAKMRNNPTEPERRLWMELRGSRVAGTKFRRQVVIGYRIAEFFCPVKGLVVEVDGHTHDLECDLAKDKQLEREFGFQTIRFSNDDIIQNMDGVLERLTEGLGSRAARWPEGRAHHPQTPSSEEEGA